MAENHRMIRKTPGTCVICRLKIPAQIIQMAKERNESADLCSKMCGMTASLLPPSLMLKMVEREFVDNEAREAYLEPIREALSMDSAMETWNQPVQDDDYGTNRTEDYMRPMGAPQVENQKPKPKPITPAAPRIVKGFPKKSWGTKQLLFTGADDAEIAQHVLMACWGTAAK